MDHFLLTEIPNVYQRALALERRIRLRELFPEGVVPYLKRQEYFGAIASPVGPNASVAPRTTTSFVAKKPLSEYADQRFTLECENSMIYLGQMDPYPFNTSVPKFDPWFRSLLKQRSPETVSWLEETYTRDPCTPERVMQHLKMFDVHWKRMPSDKHMRLAKKVVAELFAPIGQVEPIDFNFAGWHQILPHLDMSSSPGLPLRRKYATQGECLGHIYDKAKRLNHFAKFLPPGAVRAPPCMIGLRPGLLKKDELDEKLKARGVWAYPAEVKVIEMRYVIPFLERCKQVFGRIPYPVGQNMTKALPFLIDHLLNDGKWGLVTDFSKLDTCIGPDYINWAFDFLKQFFYFGMTASSEERNRNVFEFLKYYFIRTPILFPSGQFVRKTGGVPSGSGFTQIVDTLVTTLLTIYARLKMGHRIEDVKKTIFVVGDDMATSVDHDFDIPRFVRIMDQLGYVINQSKVMFSRKGIELKFLGYSKRGGGIYRPLEDLLQGAFFPEKYVGNANRSRQRILGQTIASGLSNGFLAKCNYWMEELVRWSADFDPDEVFIPQRRWLRHVLNIDEVPKSATAFDLFHLV